MHAGADYLKRAHELAALYAAYPAVVAVALGGSQASGAADARSDIDLCVYVRGAQPPTMQADVLGAAGGATRAELDLPYWGGTNLWIDAPTGIMVDAMYWGADWIEEQVTRVMQDHAPSMGYSTSFCWTVQRSRVLYDPRGWFAALQAQTAEPYPEPLRHNIVAYNYPVLRGIMTSYRAQIAYAVARDDALSVNHRVAALLASYFDIIFAVNRVFHPGEKRQLAFARSLCRRLPDGMDADIAAVLAASGTADAEVLVRLDQLLDRLDDLLRAEGWQPPHIST